MSDAGGCPDIQILRDYASGRLSGGPADEVLLHTAACAKCLSTITQLAKNPRAFDKLASDDVAEGPAGSTNAPYASTRLYDHGPPEPVSSDIDTFDMEALDPSPRSNALGRLGPYDVLSVLGRGGMGMVFKAYEETLNREVAIKVLARQLATSPKSRQRFTREAQTAAAIRHPHVVTIHAVSDFRSVPYFVMEYLAGETLQQRIKERAPLELTDVLQFGIQIASGLAEAHGRQVIHRDVKPGNIMLVPGVDGERAVLTDFGIARVMIDHSELTSLGAVMGTPAYMSPEQVRGHTIDPRSDLFSLGAVLFAMFRGRSPFHGGIPLEVARKVTELTPPPLHELHPHVPPRLSNLVSRLLEKEADKRPASAKEVVQQLRDCLAEVTQSNLVPTSRITLSEEDTSPTDAARHRSRRVVLAGVAGLMLLLSAWLLWGRDAGQSKDPGTSGSGSQNQTTGGSPSTTSELTVAKDGSGRFRKLAEALEIVRPGEVIRVTDSETYREPVLLDKAAHFAGITLEATAGAKLESPSPKLPVLMITDTPGVTVRGFRLIASSQNRTVEITGNCAGTTLEGLACESYQKLAIIVVKDTGGEVGGDPITVRSCRLNCLDQGQCLWYVCEVQPSQSVVIEDNRLGSNAVTLNVWGSFHDLTIRRNVFVHGQSAISLHLKASQPGAKINIQNNSFFEPTYWLGLFECVVEPANISLNRNLILGALSINATAAELERLAQSWNFVDNVWESRPETPADADQNGRIAKRVARFEVLSRDQLHPDFLRPKRDASAADNQPFVGAITDE